MSNLPAPITPIPPPLEVDPEPTASTPRWSPFTKFLFALVLFAIVGWLLLRFQSLVPPLGAAFILAYLMSPVVDKLTYRSNIPWSTAVAIVYVVLFVVLLVVLVVAGIAIVRQIQDFYRALIEILPNLPQRLQELTQHPVQIGPFTIDLSRPLVFGTLIIDLRQTDLGPLYDQMLNAVQPALSQTGTLVGSLASGTAEFLGWFFFTFIVSYYILHDFRSLVPAIEHAVPAGYGPDVRRLVAELKPIWNAFLRGQITISLSSFVVMGTVFTLLGVQFGPVLGVLAALAEFIPVIGAWVVTLIAVIIALFQQSNWLGLDSVTYALVVLACYAIWQQIQGNIIVPRVLGQSLKLHPALIVIGAIIGASLAGLIGLLISSPTIATVRLFGNYIYRKLVDLDPWPDPMPVPKPAPEGKWLRWVRQKMMTLWLTPKKK